MVRNASPRFFYTLLAICILAGLFGAPATLTAKTALADQAEPSTDMSYAADDPAAIQAPSENHVQNLPMIFGPPTPKFFGIEFESWYDSNSTVIQKADDAGVAWVRISAFPWRDIEPTRYNPPVYNWSVVDEAALASYASKGFNVIATVRFTPSWAQMYPPDTYCGPVAQAYLDEFAQYMQNLVARYSVPPYNILYWEIGNEPDVDPSLIPNDLDGPIGCWGDDTKQYYGGVYYATMLKIVYPAIKAANPNAQVMVGGLLMDCDPTHPPPGKTCLPTKFFEGILLGGGAPYFDVVSFHGYGYYWDGAIIEEDNINWDDRGGLVLGKIDFLKEIMAKYSVNKPIFHTETALICHPNNTAECNPPVADFYQTQADYVVWVFARVWAAGVVNSIWYPMVDGWYHTGLLYYPSFSNKPAYDAYRFIAQELLGAQYIRQVNYHAMLRTYEFSAQGKRIWVTWAWDTNPYLITLPAGVLRVLDKYGNTIVPVNGQITVGSPVYIEMFP